MAQATPADASQDRGREAESPHDIPAQGWRDILLRVKKQASENRLSLVAAGVAFYGLLAIFPALVAFVAIYGLVADPQQVESHIAALSGLLPEQASQILLTQLHDLAQTDSTALGIGAIAGVLVALWSASAGVRNLMEALNVVYQEREKRGTFFFHGTALLLTLTVLVGAALVIGILVILPIAIRMMGLGSAAEMAVTLLRWPIVAAAVILGLAIMYRYGPSRDHARWSWVNRGAVIATVLWIVGSALFSLYVMNFGNYNATYGSMAAVVILLMWFLLGGYAVLFGALIDAEMERQTGKDTTTGSAQPPGRRDARAADTLGETP